MSGGLARAGAGRGSLRVLVPAIICWIATASAVNLPATRVTLWASALVCAVGVLVVIPMIRRRKFQRHRLSSPHLQTVFTLAGITSAVTLVVLSSVLWHEAGRQDTALTQPADTHHSVVVEGTLTSFPKQKARTSGETRWVIMQGETIQTLVDTREHPEKIPGRSPILVWLDEPAPEHFGPGVPVQVTGHLTAATASDMNAFTLSATEVRELPSSAVSAEFGKLMARIRMGLRTTATQHTGGSLVPGFAVGDTSLVSPALQEAMQESSLTHLTAVSGANCALVISGSVFLASRLKAPRKMRLAISGVMLALFVALIGPDASVQRAAAMAFVLLIGTFGNHRVSGIHALGCAIIVLLARNPWQSLQPGFQLSVFATFGILTMAGPINTWLRRKHVSGFFSLPLSVCVAAQFSCAAALLTLQPGVSLVGIPANLLAAPLAPLGAGLGLLAALLLPAFPEAGHILVVLAAVPARIIEWIAFSAEQIPFGRLEWPGGLVGAGALFAVQLLGLATWALRNGHISIPGLPERAPRHRLWHEQAPLPKRINLVVALGTAVVICVVASVSVVTPIVKSAAVPQDWGVVACDVGQGDAILVRDPTRHGSAMLIDTGDDGELLDACLDMFHIQHIALLVLTHDDQDHVGALDAVAGIIHAALIAPDVSATGETRAVTRQLVEENIPFRIAAAGDSGAVKDGAVTMHNAERSVSTYHMAPQQGYETRFTVLQPYAEKHYTDTNEASVVLRIESHEFSMLALGDTGEAEHRELMRRYPPDTLNVDILKVAHHGSSDAAKTLINAADAQWALISVGAENRYGHPAKETIGSIRRAGSQILRTDMYGSIAISPRETPAVWAEKVPKSSPSEPR